MTFFLIHFLFSTLAPTFAAAEEVHVGSYVNDVQYLDLKSHSYSVDLYIWFKWKNPKINPATSFEFMNPFDEWGHTRTAVYSEPVHLPGGELYQLVRIRGRFSQKFHLENFPFDHQELRVIFEDSSGGVHNIRYLPDSKPIAMNPKLQLPGFSVGSPTLKIVEQEYPTTFGDPREKENELRYSRAVLTVPIQRPFLTYMAKFLVPVLCVIFCAAMMFLFKPTYVDSRVGIGITALLTIVALQITLNDDLPEIDYLVLIDKIYLAGYLYVIAGLAIVVKTTWMVERDQLHLDRAILWDRMGLLILTSVFLFVLLALCYSSVHQ